MSQQIKTWHNGILNPTHVVAKFLDKLLQNDIRHFFEVEKGHAFRVGFFRQGQKAQAITLHVKVNQVARGNAHFGGITVVGWDSGAGQDSRHGIVSFESYLERVGKVPCARGTKTVPTLQK